MGILSLIRNAEDYIYIAVNEYIPMDLWKKREPWTVIDDSIRKGIMKTNEIQTYVSFSLLSAILERKVTVNFLVNSLASHRDLMVKHLKRLVKLNPKKVQVKLYTVSSCTISIFKLIQGA